MKLTHLKKKKKIVFLFLVALGLCCRVRGFSSFRRWWLLFVVVLGLLLAVTALAELGLQAHGLQ